MEKSSFFNSVSSDRKYKAEDFAAYFASFIGNGVFPIPSTNLQILSNSNMTVTLKAGKAWINGYIYINTDDLTFSLDVADGLLKRIDRIVVQYSTVNREIKAKVKKGAFAASSPVAPVLQRDADAYELAIADIYINKGAISIAQADITDLRANKDLCGIVHGTVEQLDTTTFFCQYQDWITAKKAQYDGELGDWIAAKQTDYNNWYDANTKNFFDMFNTWYDSKTNTWTTDFNSWFDAVKGQLTTDQAGNLYTMIAQLQEDTKIVDNVTQKKYKWGIENGIPYLQEV